MNDSCGKIQEHLIAGNNGGLSPEARRHVAVCPACGEVERDLSSMEPVLAEVAAQVRAHEAVRLDSALKGRVKAEALRRLAGTRERAGVESSMNRHGGRRSLLNWFTPRMAWAAAAVACVVVAGAMLGREFQGRDVGQLNFAAGEMRVRHGDRMGGPEGLTTAFSLDRGAMLETGSEGRGLFTLGPAEAARVAMDRDTRVRVAGAEELALERGTVWLSVKPEGKGFRVTTPFGMVTVTGTKFSVSVSGTETRVEVSEGNVMVTNEAGKGVVPAGEMLSANANGVGVSSPRAGGTALPVWVEQLAAEKSKAENASYVPSISSKIQ